MSTNKKKTFDTHILAGVTEKIGLFSKMSQDVKCVNGRRPESKQVSLLMLGKLRTPKKC